jgi:hypothetical protein
VTKTLFFIFYRKINFYISFVLLVFAVDTGFLFQRF